MPDTIFVTAAQLGGTVFTVLIFLYYLSKRDKELHESRTKSSESNVVLARALQKLTDIVERNSDVLENSLVNRKENTEAVKDNTGVVDKNTEATIKNGKH